MKSLTVYTQGASRGSTGTPHREVRVTATSRELLRATDVPPTTSIWNLLRTTTQEIA
jgi:hypothetical protein